jgi:AraC family transcriptional regulator
MDHHYISFTVRGSLHIERDLGEGLERADFRHGSSLIMGAGQENRWRWDRPTTELQLYLRPGFLEETAEQAGVGVPRLIDRFAFEDPVLRQAVQALLDELRHPAAGAALFGDVAAQFVALQLLRRHCTARPRSEPRVGGLAPAQLRRVVELVDARLDEELGLDDLAAAARVSRFHFARAFRRSTGHSPHRWLVARRLERARELLDASDLTVAEVAVRVGFRSQSHFGQVFRAATGATPTAYRRARRDS